MSDFSSMCLFRPFCDAFLSRLLTYAVNSGLSSGICGGALAVSLKSELSLMLNCGFFWEFAVGNTYLGTLYVKGGRRQKNLILGSLRPGEVCEDFYTEDTVYNTMTGGSELPGNADLLLYCLKEGVHHSTPPV